MIDANLNRAAEGLRTIEDVMRFGFDNAGFSGDARRLRHAFRNAVRRLVSCDRMIESRDSGMDVGASRWRGGMRRTTLRDILIAGFRRTQESARVLEEAARLFGKESVVRHLQNLRYRSYSLEKQVLLATADSKRINRPA